MKKILLILFLSVTVFSCLPSTLSDKQTNSKLDDFVGTNYQDVLILFSGRCELRESENYNFLICQLQEEYCSTCTYFCTSSSEYGDFCLDITKYSTLIFKVNKGGIITSWSKRTK